MELPDGTEVYVFVPSSVTARVAKRIANRWLISEVGNLLMADNGSLVATEQGWVWQFEVYITSIAHKAWGPIGTLDVSAVQAKSLTQKHQSLFIRTWPNLSHYHIAIKKRMAIVCLLVLRWCWRLELFIVGRFPILQNPQFQRIAHQMVVGERNANLVHSGIST